MYVNVCVCACVYLCCWVIQHMNAGLFPCVHVFRHSIATDPVIGLKRASVTSLNAVYINNVVWSREVCGI